MPAIDTKNLILNEVVVIYLTELKKELTEDCNAITKKCLIGERDSAIQKLEYDVDFVVEGLLPHSIHTYKDLSITLANAKKEPSTTELERKLLEKTEKLVAAQISYFETTLEALKALKKVSTNKPVDRNDCLIELNKVKKCHEALSKLLTPPKTLFATFREKLASLKESKPSTDFTPKGPS